MKNTTQTEVDNLVMFPASKNFSLESSLHDPLEEILNEFSDLLDSDFEDELDLLEQEELEDSEVVYGSLDEYMNRNKIKASLQMVNAEMRNNANEMKLQEIQAMQEQIKYYLDDIEMFLPRKN